MQSGRAGKEDINAKCVFMNAQSKTETSLRETVRELPTMAIHSLQFECMQEVILPTAPVRIIDKQLLMATGNPYWNK